METNISEKIRYIGVNDRTTHRFEALWPIPSGVSYNSYLIKGNEKSAIIDGVEIAHASEQIDAIRRALGDSQPDYLIINHMEPDHSGSIAVLRSVFPNLTIVGNVQTLNMVNGFYGLTDNTLTVKNGDTLHLGEDTTLRFFLTPMVHWPETMMTLHEEEKTLFSGDAFGCFGALNGAVVDEAMDTEPYFPEMVRYYSNIVGKYGTFVQKAFNHIAGAEFHTICPTHGPVWHRDLSRVIKTYDMLSRYEALDEGATVVYGSMYGNTARMAEAAAEGLAAAGIRNISVHDASVSDLSYIIADIFRHRRLVIASPTYSDGVFPPIAAVIDAMAVRGIKNRMVALLGSCTWAPRAVKDITAALAGCGIELTGTPVSVKQAPDSDKLAECRALGYELGKAENRVKNIHTT